MTMLNSWTFGRKLAFGFGAVVLLTAIICLVSVVALREVAGEKDRLVQSYTETLTDVRKMQRLSAERAAYNRGYLLNGDEEQRALAVKTREEAEDTHARVKQAVKTDRERQLLEEIERAREEHWQASVETHRARKNGASIEAVARLFDERVNPKARRLEEKMDTFAELEKEIFEAAKIRSNQVVDQAIQLVTALAAATVLLAIAVAYGLTRTLSRQIGSAIQHLQSSSTELQAASTQQAAGSGQQAAAMGEVSTTMRELLTTSLQIAEAAQRVARIADETAAAARSGDGAAVEAQEAVAVIKRQVDQIVTHMLDLGQKTQQVGGILEIIKELAEQTNILAINATIEAAGAGDHGKRFAAVAEEIRKLADRVGGSANEIRALIEEIRAAANTSVMATEAGSKAVDGGARQFIELTTSFRQIASQVETTADAAREIELSTKQQATAVEQVNHAITDAAQAAKETEASSRQTMQTSSQLADLSRELVLLIQSTPRA